MKNSLKGCIVAIGLALGLTGCGEPPKKSGEAYQQSEHFQTRVARCMERTGGTRDSCKLEGMAGMLAWEKNQGKK